MPLEFQPVDKEPEFPTRPALMKEKAASNIAWTMVLAYVVLIGIPLLLVLFSVATPSEAVDLMKTVAAVLGGPVGAVIGYYYRATR